MELVLYVSVLVVLVFLALFFAIENGIDSNLWLCVTNMDLRDSSTFKKAFMSTSYPQAGVDARD